LASIPILREAAPPDELAWQFLAVCERAAAGILLLAVLPLLAASALIVWMLSGRTPFIAHRRVGWRGSELWMLKLRTMWGATAPAPCGWLERIDDSAGPANKHPRDARVPNAFARFCRRHSVDELPQLWHVVTGEMSLVGPRPLTRREIREHYGEAAAELLRVKPGLAGLWQTSGRNRLTYAERRRLDLEFVRSRSIAMYLRIVIRTLPEIAGGSNSW